MTSKEKNIEEIIAELEKLAADVLRLKNESIPRRPIVIEFCGSPKSGKSTCINSLSLFLRRNNFRIRVLTERASVCPVIDKYDPNFNVWTACSAIAELVEILSNNSKDYDVVIMDRGIFDALCWFNWLKQNDSLDNENFDSLERFLVMRKWRAAIDLIYVFTATPEVSLDREYASLLTRKVGSIMCNDALVSYRSCIETSAQKYKDKFQKIELFDTSNKKQNDVNYEVTNSVLEIIQENISEKIGHFDKSLLSKNQTETFLFLDSNLAKARLNFRSRHTVEADDNLVQPIPILVMTDNSRSQVLVVKKNKKTTSKNSPESDRTLLYLGGHTRQEDSLGDPSKSFLEVCRQSLHREIKEETGINYIPPETDSNPLCIWVRDDERSIKHLAICFVMEVNFSRTKVKLDKNEFMSGGNTKSGKILKINEVVERPQDLENWSRLILREIFKSPIDAGSLL
jgi:predicted NUDIX family phosphoesterase